MKAEIKAKIDNRERTPLQAVIPLNVPYSVQIDISDACNMKCDFCFHSDLDSIKRNNVRFGIMELGVYKKIIDDMKRDWTEKVRKLRLFALGEPLLNKYIIEMIRYAKDANVAEIIELTTNGTLLNNDFCSRIGDSGIGIINISINGICAEQYEKHCGYRMDWEHFVNGIRELYDNKGDAQIYIKMSDTGYSEQEKAEFFDTFGDICDQIFVENISSSLWQDTHVEDNIKKNETGIYGQKLIRKKVCTSVFTTMIINSFGQAKLCCADWKNQLIIGDTGKQSIDEIWHGKPLHDIQIAFLKGLRNDMPLCLNCEQPEISNPDNIDDYMEQLLIKMNGSV